MPDWPGQGQSAAARCAHVAGVPASACHLEVDAAEVLLSRVIVCGRTGLPTGELSVLATRLAASSLARTPPEHLPAIPVLVGAATLAALPPMPGAGSTIPARGKANRWRWQRPAQPEQGDALVERVLDGDAAAADQVCAALAARGPALRESPGLWQAPALLVLAFAAGERGQAPAACGLVEHAAVALLHQVDARTILSRKFSDDPLTPLRQLIGLIPALAGAGLERCLFDVLRRLRRRLANGMWLPVESQVDLWLGLAHAAFLLSSPSADRLAGAALAAVDSLPAGSRYLLQGVRRLVMRFTEMEPKALRGEPAEMVAPETWPNWPEPTRPPLPPGLPRTLRIGHSPGGPVKLPPGARGPCPPKPPTPPQ